MSQFYAVLTGDIVKSTHRDAPPLEEVRATLAGAVHQAQSAWGCVVGEVDVFRGDSWQLLLDAPGRALEIALLVRAALRWTCGMDTRVAIAVGPVDTIVADRISQSTGAAFLASGRLLDSMKSGRLAIAQTPILQAHAAWIGVAFGLIDRQVSQWTRRQAEIVRLALLDPAASQSVLGESLVPPASQQTAGQLLQDAGWATLMPAIDAFHATCGERIGTQ